MVAGEIAPERVLCLLVESCNIWAYGGMLRIYYKNSTKQCFLCGDLIQKCGSLGGGSHIYRCTCKYNHIRACVHVRTRTSLEGCCWCIRRVFDDLHTPNLRGMLHQIVETLRLKSARKRETAAACLNPQVVAVHKPGRREGKFGGAFIIASRRGCNIHATGAKPA